MPRRRPSLCCASNTRRVGPGSAAKTPNLRTMSLTLSGLEGKIAVVTGAGRMRSIGRPIAVELARAGCDVVLTGTGRAPDRYPDDEKAAGWRDIESVADEVRALGRQALPLISDVSSQVEVTSLAERVYAELGRCDFVINNAGASRGADRVPVTELDYDIWRKVIDVNLHGTFLMSQVFAQRMIAAGNGGGIVNISSVAGRMMPHSTAAYAASKAAIHALSCSMAKELGPNGIRVNVLCPGLIDTSRMDDMHAAGSFDRMVNTVIPLRRAGTGEDIAAMVAFLCSDQGSWITGEVITVDGGQLAHP